GRHTGRRQGLSARAFRAMVTPMTNPDERAAETAPDLGLLRVLLDDGSVDPRTDPKMPRELLSRAYREIKRLRLLDARMILLQRRGAVGFYGACTGQEATPVATALAIEPSD